ncbi:DUF4160 domain-containing protein [Rhodoplanes serenus]|nr:DUF4160 domain-containing protein [Rhodoplanes serenus]
MAIIDGVKIQFYAREHAPPHFHAIYAEHRAQIAIGSLQVLKGGLPPATLATVLPWAEPRQDAPDAGVGRDHRPAEAGEDPMTAGTLHIVAAEPVLHGVLKLTWDDGYEGIVDLRGIMAHGDIFTPLRDPASFKTVHVSPFGHSIYWGEEGDETVDFGCDRLRDLAEQQAALLARAS